MSFFNIYMTGITFQYPFWFIFFCLTLGVIYALGLYYKSKIFLEQSKKLNWILGIIRFLSISILSMLLLSPVLKSLITETKKPILVFAQDNSQSIASSMSSESIQRYKQDLENVKTSLSENYEVKQYTFGEKINENKEIKFDERISNISDVIKNIYDVYSNQNLGAIVLASDGIYNEGSSPLYAATKINSPIYTIALGDTVRKKDLSIRRIFANKIAYLSDKFNVQADISAINCTGSATQISIYQEQGGNWKKLQNINQSISKSDFFQTLSFTLDADVAGVQHFRMIATEIAGETTKENNSKDFYIDVLDARQKILILANAPHPDVTAIKQSIEKNKNYKVEVAITNQNNPKITEFDFVILHQLPSRNNDISLILKQLNEKKIPRLFVVGQNTNFAAFNTVQSQVIINGGSNENVNDVTGKVNPNFSTFTYSEKISKDIPNFAPIISPFAADYKESPNSNVFMYQRIGKVDTKFPLIIVGEESSDTKVGVITAEGLWKWRLFDYLQHQNHEIFDEIIGKTIQFLSIKADKRKFRVASAKNLYNENEQVLFDAELYNDNFELVNDPDVSMTITNSKGQELLFTFNKSGRMYSLNAKQLPVDAYTFKAKTNFNGQELIYSGKFNIQSLQMEIYETTANHALLNTLSVQHGGKMYYPYQLSALSENIKSNNNVKSIIYQTNKTRSVINLKWIFFLILSLLSIEWFARRYFGAY